MFLDTMNSSYVSVDGDGKKLLLFYLIAFLLAFKNRYANGSAGAPVSHKGLKRQESIVVTTTC